jgi:hypothetical protein
VARYSAIPHFIRQGSKETFHNFIFNIETIAGLYQTHSALDDPQDAVDSMGCALFLDRAIFFLTNITGCDNSVTSLSKFRFSDFIKIKQ